MSATAASVTKFPLGDLVVTPSALNRLMQDDILSGIARHRSGDWGNIGANDRKENDMALERGSPLYSIYRAVNGETFYIITEADRSRTTVLMPEDY